MFASIRTSVHKCFELNQKLDAAKTVCNLTKEEWDCMFCRKISLVTDDRVCACIREFGADLACLLDNIDKDLDTLGDLDCLKHEPVTWRLHPFNSVWNKHVSCEQQSLQELIAGLDDILKRTGTWYSIMSEREDSGSSSSYSDYSASKTESSDDDDDDDSDSRSK